MNWKDVREEIPNGRWLGLEAAQAHQPPPRRPFPVETANRLVIEAFDGRPSLAFSSRGWPPPGRMATWLEEVRQHLPVDADPADRDDLLRPPGW